MCVSSMGVCVCVSFSYTPTLINFISLHLGSPTNRNIPQAYILLGGYPPFYSETNDNDELFEKICKAKYTFDPEWWDPVSPQAKDFIKKLLVVNQDKRLTASQAMRHEWGCSPFATTPCKGGCEAICCGRHLGYCSGCRRSGYCSICVHPT